MNIALSVYLDIFRMLAALVVFLSHTAGTRLTAFLIPQAISFSSDAVVAFFVLSGFVIGYVADTREKSAGTYAISRLARVYSVALPAIIVTLVCDTAGRSVQPEFYVGFPTISTSTTWAEVFCCILFVNELWSTHLQLGTNGPYWSLGFEVWYYVLFGLVKFVPRPWYIAAIVLWLAIVGPRVASAFPIWLLGYAAYAFIRTRTIATWAGFLVFIVSLVSYLPYHLIFGQVFVVQNQYVFDYNTLRGYGYYYGLGLLISLNFIGLFAMPDVTSAVAARIARPIRWLAGATFTFYLMHLPVAVMLCAISPWPPESNLTRVIVIGGTLIIMLGLAEIGERRKEWWRKLFARLLGPGKKRIAA